mgnify:CR=1 FL=1
MFCMTLTGLTSATGFAAPDRMHTLGEHRAARTTDGDVRPNKTTQPRTLTSAPHCGGWAEVASHPKRASAPWTWAASLALKSLHPLARACSAARLGGDEQRRRLQAVFVVRHVDDIELGNAGGTFFQLQTVNRSHVDSNLPCSRSGTQPLLRGRPVGACDRLSIHFEHRDCRRPL